MKENTINVYGQTLEVDEQGKVLVNNKKLEKLEDAETAISILIKALISVVR